MCIYGKKKSGVRQKRILVLFNVFSRESYDFSIYLSVFNIQLQAKTQIVRPTMLKTSIFSYRSIKSDIYVLWLYNLRLGLKLCFQN